MVVYDESEQKHIYRVRYCYDQTYDIQNLVGFKCHVHEMTKTVLPFSVMKKVRT